MSTYLDGDLPFPRGKTFFGSGTPDTTSGANLEGREFWVQDKLHGTGKRVRLKIVRNKAAAALESKRLVLFTADANCGRHVDGYCRLTAGLRAGVVDDAYGTKTIAVNDLFYIVTEGAVECLPDLAAGANNLIPANTILVALTAATSGATTAGRIAPQDLTGATALLAEQVQNAIGRAITARTTANTTLSVLIEMGKSIV